MEAAIPKDVGPSPRMKPKEVSVICTARNAGATIERTIESIRAQDFQNWEMIIVDDGSTDDTVSIVHAFAQTDSRIRLIATGGVGRGRALNRALSETQTDLVANIDADDESHPARLRLQMHAMAQHPEFGVLCTERLLISGHGPADWPEHVGSLPLQVTGITLRLMFENPVDHSSVLMRKPLLLWVGGYSETRNFQFDYDLWVRLAEMGCDLGKLEMPLTAKRIHNAQSFENRSRINYVMSSVNLQLRAIKSLNGGAVPFMTVPFRILWNLLPAALRLHLAKFTSQLLARAQVRYGPQD